MTTKIKKIAYIEFKGFFKDHKTYNLDIKDGCFYGCVSNEGYGFKVKLLMGSREGFIYFE